MKKSIVMETLIIDVETDRLQQLKDFLTSMNIKFRNSTVLSKEKPYNPEFVERILKSREQHKEGKGRVVKIDDLWK